jgi:Ca2+-binding EF-hand superfamily protein
MRWRFKHILPVLLVAVLLLCCGISKGRAANELFAKIDENEDGKIERKEFSEKMREYAFEKIDKNKDKFISKEEWGSINNINDREEHSELFKHIDKNSNQKISFFEFWNYADKHSNVNEAFMDLDSDGDNNLSPVEFTVRPPFKMVTIYIK